MPAYNKRFSASGNVARPRQYEAINKTGNHWTAIVPPSVYASRVC